MIKRIVLITILPIVVLSSLVWAKRPFPTNAAPTAIQAPVLKWENAGCYSSWCETGWYSSPAVADIDGDGDPEIIASAYSIVSLDGDTGDVEWRVKSGHDRSEGTGPDNVGRTWPGIVVADVDNNGDLEIVTAHGNGWVSVYNHAGYFEPGWPRRPVTNELRGLSVADIDNNGDLEIIVTAARASRVNTWVYEHNGVKRGGWPQLNNDSGYAWGVFNDNAAIGDIDDDGTAEIVVPSDMHYINAYEKNGAQIPAHPMYDGKGWGKVGIWESPSIELRGWGWCNGDRAESYRTNFAYGPALIADVNGDGIVEVVATGNVYDCHAGYPPSQYIGVYIFNSDRSRFNTGGYNWETVPVNTGAPLKEDYSVIESAMPNPVTADLDGDGKLEILFASYDGRLHAYWLDKTEHHNWPYNVSGTGSGIRFASEPVVADLDNDGLAEIIFTSWPQKGNGYVGKLHILDYQGNALHEPNLPAIYGNKNWNGALSAPTLANIDDDADLEIVINTANSGFVAYDLPGTENARVLWGTGRGNYQRTGSYLELNDSGIASPILPEASDLVTYTIQVYQPAQTFASVHITDSLPAEVTYFGNLTATSGQVSESSGIITWEGDVRPEKPVTIQFAVTVNPAITTPTPIINEVQFDDGLGREWERSIVVIANGEAVYLPMIMK